MKHIDDRSWFSGTCKDCGYNVVITQPIPEVLADYWWYCSNKACENHQFGMHTADMDVPEWVKREGKK